MKEELIDEKRMLTDDRKYTTKVSSPGTYHKQKLLYGHNHIIDNDHRRAVVALWLYSSPLNYNKKVLYPARRTSEIVVRACGSES